MTSDHTRLDRRTVLCYGDSNTWGFSVVDGADPVPRLPVEERWVTVMASALGPAYTVIDEGLPGRTTVFDDPIGGEHLNGRRMLLGCLQSHKPVDLVVLVLGTNDLQARYAASAYDIAEGAGQLIRLISVSECGPDASAPDVLLVAPPPTNVAGQGALVEAMLAGADEKSQHLDAAFAAVAKTHGVGYLNAGEVIKSSPLDGVHWSADSHRALGQALATTVEAGYTEHPR